MKKLLNKHLDLSQISRQVLKVRWLFPAVYDKVTGQKRDELKKNWSTHKQNLEGIKRGQDLLGWKITTASYLQSLSWQNILQTYSLELQAKSKCKNPL